MRRAEYAWFVAFALALGCRRPAAARGGELYVSSEQAGSVAAIDLGTNALVATIPVGKRPRGVQVSPDGKSVYVALSGSTATGPGVARDPGVADKAADGIGVIDVAKHALAGVLAGGSDPEQFAVSSDGRTLYVANEDTAELSVVDTGGARPRRGVAIGTEPEGVALTPDGATALIACETSNRIDVVDTKMGAVIASIPVGARPRAIAVSRDGAFAIVTLEDAASVALVGVAARKLLKTTKLAGENVRPMGVALSPDGRTAYVTTGRGKRLFALRAETCTEEWSLEVGERPWGVAVAPDGRHVYTANGPSDDVSVVDVETRRVTARVAVPGKPWGLALAP